MYALALGLALLGLWQIAIEAQWFDPYVLPSPHAVLNALVDERSTLLHDLGTTASEAILGLFAAIALGTLIAVAMHEWQPVRRALYPFVIASQALPFPVLAVPLILLLGFGLAPKIAIVAIVCFFPVTINVFDGLRSADADQRKLLRSMGASRAQTLLRLEAPAALPQSFTGMRIAAAVSVIGAVFAENSGSQSGLGHAVLSSALDPDFTFAVTAVLFALALALYGAFALAERLLITWKEP
jgi:ABC-type nitrate/sulfonate/bicarbonate transport system permease component